MRLDASDLADLQPLIEAAVCATLNRDRGRSRAQVQRPLGYTEAEAADLIGVPRHATLRDCRLRGELIGRLVGKKIVYERGELLRFLRDEAIKSPKHGGRCTDGKRSPMKNVRQPMLVRHASTR